MFIVNLDAISADSAATNVEDTIYTIRTTSSLCESQIAINDIACLILGLNLNATTFVKVDAITGSTIIGCA